MADKFRAYDDATGREKLITLAQAQTLMNVENGATADQTGAEIKTAYEGEANTNAFTDAEQTKLSGIESGATADQTGAEIKAAYEGEADIKGAKQTITMEVPDLSAAVTHRLVLPACTVKKLWSVIDGALATGDATLTSQISGSAITNGVITITQAASAAGDVDSATPTAANTATAGQVLELVVGGTNTAGVRADVTVEIEI